MDAFTPRNAAYKKDWGFYISELKSEQCLCEREKRPMKSFCYRCFKALPVELQQALYRRLGNGYEEAYDQAAVFLSREGII